MKRFARTALVILTLTCCAGSAHATGYFRPAVYLDEGGKNVNASPEFYWELEAKRLAKGFAPTEKRLAAPASKRQSETDDAVDDSRSQMTADVDMSDFVAALREGRIKPENSEK